MPQKDQLSLVVFYNLHTVINNKVIATAHYVLTFLHNRSFGAFPTYTNKSTLSTCPKLLYYCGFW